MSAPGRQLQYTLFSSCLAGGWHLARPSGMLAVEDRRVGYFRHSSYKVPD